MSHCCLAAQVQDPPPAKDAQHAQCLRRTLILQTIREVADLTWPEGRSPLWSPKLAWCLDMLRNWPGVETQHVEMHCPAFWPLAPKWTIGHADASSVPAAQKWFE
eukprot:5529326-Amphidinium_carterae.1